jgi:hypothetical protein
MTFLLPRDRIFAVSLVISFVFHLSMVSLFRIVIYFPKNNVDYYAFTIVDSTTKPTSPYQALTVPSADKGLERLRNETSKVDETSLPKIQIPTLKFSELDLVRIKQQGLDIRSKYKELFDTASRDSWSTFGNRLNEVGGQLFGGADRSADSSQLPISRPAPGFEAFLEWMTPPKTRQPLSVEKIDSLWGASPETLTEPLILVFRVNRKGRVVFVLPPLEDESGLVDDAVAALIRYQFEPIGEDGPEQQHGTLLIRSSENR